MALGLRIFTGRAGNRAGEPVLDTQNGEELMHVQPGVAIVLGNRPPESPGTLYISTKKVIWLSDVDNGKDYAVDFLSLSLHATSRDPEAYPSPCIYAQIETEGNENESDSDTNDILNLSKVREMRLVPSDPSQLDTLFDVFCECAELNPEPVDVDDEEHNWVFSADQMADGESDGEDYIYQNPSHSIGDSNGNHDLDRRVLELEINDHRFDDAEEMEHQESSHN